MDFGPSGATPPWPCPQGLHQNSECVPPVLIHRAIACESFEILAKMVLERRCDITDGHTDGLTLVSQYPRFFFEKRGDNQINNINAVNIPIFLVTNKYT